MKNVEYAQPLKRQEKPGVLHIAIEEVTKIPQPEWAKIIRILKNNDVDFVWFATADKEGFADIFKRLGVIKDIGGGD